MAVSSRTNDLFEAATFAGTLALAFGLGWRTSDLIWGLWASSLTIGFVVVFAGGVRRILRPNATILERIFSSIGAIGSLVLFSVHFGSAHYLYAAILDLLMPLMDHPGRVYVGKLTWTGGTSFSFWETLEIALATYWPMVLLNGVRDRTAIGKSTATTGKEAEPYGAILKLHFLVMGLGASYAIGLDSFPVYAVVYTLLYSPTHLWKMIRRISGRDKQGLSQTNSQTRSL